MFRAGIDRGMDQTISQEGYGRVVAGIAGVLTDLRTGRHAYAVSDTIVRAISNRGITTDPVIVERLGAKVPDNLRSAVLIDSILDGMWRDVNSMSVDDVRGFGADDIGIIDYTHLAFWLFGHQVRAFYYLFFVILGSSIVVAFIERRRDPAGKLIVVAALAVLYAICFYSPVMDESNPSMGLGTLTNTRFLSLLSVVPGVHILLLLAERARLTLLRALAVAFQSAVIFFAVFIRATAEWISVGLFAAAIVGMILSWRALAGRSFASRIAVVLRPQWPALVVVCVVAAGVTLVTMSLHEVYRRDGWLHQHALWHSIYYSYATHPSYYTSEYFNLHDRKVGDDMPVAGIFLYLNSHPEEDKPDIYLAEKVLKYSAMESLARAAFFDFAWQHPRFAFEAFFVWKPWAIRKGLSQLLLVEWDSLTFRSASVLVIITVMIGILAGADVERSSLGNLARYCVLLSVMLVPCLGIPWLTVADTSAMSEQLFAVQIAILLLVSFAVACLVRLGRRYVPAATMRVRDPSMAWQASSPSGPKWIG
jgi:hypothetical protein